MVENNLNYPELKKVQEKELDILLEIDKVCRKLNLVYSIAYGTLLGAVRHQGFIPWDDDIDVIMPRKDYEIFLKEAQKYLPLNLFLQHYTTEKNNNDIYIKIRDKNTVFLEGNSEEFDICHGIFVDVFAIDKVKNSQDEFDKELSKRLRFVNKVICYSKNNISTIQNPIKRFLARLYRLFICKPVPLVKTLRKEDSRRKQIDQNGDDCYFLGFTRWCGVASYNELFNTIKINFDGHEVMASKEYDKILKIVYGNDYMVIPPIEKRITHKPKKIVL